MVEIITHHRIKVCPHCGASDFIRDFKREETYCNKCGLVLMSAFQYVGLEKIENITPFSAPFEARHKVHYSWIHKEDKGKTNNRNVTNFKHNIPNTKLMIKGYKGR